MIKFLHVGGLVAVGFDRTGTYLLTVSHTERGVFSTAMWERVARSAELAYPDKGVAIGIGPIEGECISVSEWDANTSIRVVSPDGRIELHCESSGIEVHLR